MLKRLISAYWMLLIPCFVALPSAGQTLKERSNKAYLRLHASGGRDALNALNELTIYRMHDSVDRAFMLAHRAVDESYKLKNGSAYAKSLVLLSSVYLKKNLIDSAEYYLNKAGNIFDSTPNADYGPLFYYNRGQICLKQNALGNAIENYTKAILLSDKTKDYTTKGRSYTGLAKCYQIQGKTKEYSISLDKAARSFTKSSDPVQTGPALIGLGISYLDLGLQEKANEQFINALRLLELTADSLFLGYTCMNLSGLYATTSQEFSEAYYQKSLKIFTALKNERGIAYDLNLRGSGYFSAKEYSKALPLLLEAAALKTRSADWQGAGFVYGNLSDVYLAINQPVKAAAALNKAEQMVVKTGDALLLAAISQSKGKYFSYLKEYDKALDCFRNSLESAGKLGFQSLANECLLAISETYQAKGNAKAALKYYKLYTSAKDSVEKASDKVSIAELQLKYETEKKDYELRSELHKGLKSEHGYIYIVGSIVAVVLILFVTVKFFLRLTGNFTDRFRALLDLRREGISNSVKGGVSFLRIEPVKSFKQAIPEEIQTDLWHRLHELMENEKLFLQNDLKLSELARKLNTNTTYLSKVINDISCQNFCNYLNHYRIEEACRLLSEPKNRNLTIEGIAQTVGFRSKSAFNAAFRKIKSVTPSEYLLRLSEGTEKIA